MIITLIIKNCDISGFGFCTILGQMCLFGIKSRNIKCSGMQLIFDILFKTCHV